MFRVAGCMRWVQRWCFLIEKRLRLKRFTLFSTYAFGTTVLGAIESMGSSTDEICEVVQPGQCFENAYCTDRVMEVQLTGPYGFSWYARIHTSLVLVCLFFVVYQEHLESVEAYFKSRTPSPGCPKCPLPRPRGIVEDVYDTLNIKAQEALAVWIGGFLALVGLVYR